MHYTPEGLLGAGGVSQQTRPDSVSVKEKWPSRVGLNIRLLGISAAIIPRAAGVLTLPFLTEKLPGSSRHGVRKKGVGVEIENCERILNRALRLNQSYSEQNC